MRQESSLARVLVLSLLLLGFMAPARADEQEKLRQEAFVFKTLGERELKIEVYFPVGWSATDRRPVILFFFGGGWNHGEIEQFRPQAEYFARRGLVTALPDYRVRSRDQVAPDDCVRDTRSAVRWVRENAARLGVDPQKLVTAGGSAGGHLAACALIEESVDHPDDDLSISTVPQAMLLFNPVLDFREPRMLRRIGGDEGLASLISPLVHLDEDAPPAVIFFGSEDQLKPHGDRYREKAATLGVRAEEFLAPGEDHGFFNGGIWRQKTLLAADRFLASLGLVEGDPPALPERKRR